MTLKATKFTPSVLLSAPRRSSGQPNSSGKKVLYTVSTYSFEEHKKTSQIRVLDIASGESVQLYEDGAFSEPVWIDEDQFLFLKSGTNGSTTLALGRASEPGAPPKEIQTFDHGLSNLKVRKLDDGSIAFALTGLITPDGEPFNAQSDAGKAKAKAAQKAATGTEHSSARIYTKLFVRHWDSYVSENTSTIWYGRLDPKAGCALVGGRLTNLLQGATGLESPVPTFGGTGDFALGPHGIAFVSRDPAYNDATTTITNLYYVPFGSYDEASPPSPIAIKTGALKGYSASPVFSPDGSKLAFTRMESPQYESDKPRLLLVPDVGAFVNSYSNNSKECDSESDVLEFYPTEDGKGAWDARPDSILWSADGSELFVTAELHGRNTLYRLPSAPDVAMSSGLPHVIIGGRELIAGEAAEPGRSFHDEGEEVTTGFQPLLGHGSVSDVCLLTAGNECDGRLFVTMSSQVDSSLYTILDPGQPTTSLAKAALQRLTMNVVSSQSRHGSAFGLSRSQLGEIWFKGAGDYNVHALVVRPSNFYALENRGKKWPLALLIHGGPQGAWGDSWSTRWNPAIFAEQGYIVVAPNPTGSSSYGMALQDGIQNEWGGRPYQDIVNCVDHVAATLPYVDMSRAVALGASYGGYMINWIQGQPLGRRLKALVCHDGVFSTLNQYSSEELFFPLHDFGGTLWDNRAGYEKWDPAKHTGAWATPMLVVHNELDYRLPVTEGLSMFNVLQSRHVPSRFLSFPDENHWVLKPENSLVWHKEVLDWINKYAQPSDEAEVETETWAASLERKVQSLAIEL